MKRFSVQRWSWSRPLEKRWSAHLLPQLLRLCPVVLRSSSFCYSCVKSGSFHSKPQQFHGPPYSHAGGCTPFLKRFPHINKWNSISCRATKALSLGIPQRRNIPDKVAQNKSWSQNRVQVSKQKVLAKQYRHTCACIRGVYMCVMYCSISPDRNVFANLEPEQRDKAATDK